MTNPVTIYNPTNNIFSQYSPFPDDILIESHETYSVILSPGSRVHLVKHNNNESVIIASVMHASEDAFRARHHNIHEWITSVQNTKIKRLNKIKRTIADLEHEANITCNTLNLAPL